MCNHLNVYKTSWNMISKQDADHKPTALGYAGRIQFQITVKYRKSLLSNGLEEHMRRPYCAEHFNRCRSMFTRLFFQICKTDSLFNYISFIIYSGLQKVCLPQTYQHLLHWGSVWWGILWSNTLARQECCVGNWERVSILFSLHWISWMNNNWSMMYPTMQLICWYVWGRQTFCKPL